MKRYLTTGETAQYCGVTLRTVINWIKRGRLRAHQLPGARGDNRISPEDLVSFMQEAKLPIPEELQHDGPSKRSILVVDDDLLMAKAIKRVLIGEGFEVCIAQDGFEAGMLYQKMKPILITLDLQMPKLNGFDLLEQLKDRKVTKILVVSAMENHQLKRALELGANDFMAKPFDNQALISKITQLLKP